MQGVVVVAGMWQVVVGCLVGVAGAIECGWVWLVFWISGIFGMGW